MTDVKEMTRTALASAGKANPAKSGALTDPKGLAAAGVTIAALPLVVGGVSKLLAPKVSQLGDKASELGDQAKEKATAQVKEKADELTPDMPKKLFGGGLFGGMFGNGDSDGDQGAGEGSAAPGHGSGRRMPIQQSVDVAVPIKVAYNQWTRFEDWPEFMHRLESVDQVDDSTVAFQTKIWGVKKRFEAEIIEQRPDERIEWDVTEGYAHTGVVTFHKLSDRLTRIEVTLDAEPDNLVDKASRGMRFVKRAVRGDLHRFKAYVELNEEAERGWRGTIEQGKVKRKTERTQSSRSRGASSRSSSNGRSRGSSSRSRAKSGSSSGGR